VSPDTLPEYEKKIKSFYEVRPYHLCGTKVSGGASPRSLHQQTHASNVTTGAHAYGRGDQVPPRRQWCGISALQPLTNVAI
jgi:hypothetical protein